MIYLLLLLNLLLTILIEGLVAVLLFRSREMVYYSFLCNLLTNPTLNLLLLVAVRLWGYSAYGFVLLILELAAIFVEAYVLKLLCRFSNRRAVAVSGFLNVLSCVMGMLIYEALGPQSYYY